jgi:hypothetical protein
LCLQQCEEKLTRAVEKAELGCEALTSVVKGWIEGRGLARETGNVRMGTGRARSREAKES